MKARMIITYTIVCGMLAACGSTPKEPVPPPPIKVNGLKPGIDTLSRIEVIQASKECLQAKMKPNVQYVAVNSDYGKVLVPVNVLCDPYK